MSINYDYHEIYDSSNFNYEGELVIGGTSTSSSTSTSTSSSTTSSSTSTSTSTSSSTSTSTTLNIDYKPKLDRVSSRIIN